jgi:hypothetical protein
MNWLKSVWMRMRKSNGLPGNEVLVPMTELPRGTQIEVKLPEQKPKRTIIRKKKETKDVTN